MSKVTTEDGRAAIAAIDAMSQENRADTPMDRGARDPSPPWLVALVRTMRGANTRMPDEDRWVAPVYDGDRPADLADADLDQLQLGTQFDRNCHAMPADSTELFERSIRTHCMGGRLAIRFGDLRSEALLEHAIIHRALAGEDYATRYERIKRDGGVITETTTTEAQTGPTIKGCPWCKEAM